MTSPTTSVGSVGEERAVPRSEADSRSRARSRLQGLLGRAVAFPEGALHQEFAGGAWEREVEGTLEALPFSLNFEGLSLTPTKLTREDSQAEYGRLSQTGFSGALSCSLFVGRHERGRRRVTEGPIRFHGSSGLRLRLVRTAAASRTLRRRLSGPEGGSDLRAWHQALRVGNREGLFCAG